MAHAPEQGQVIALKGKTDGFSFDAYHAGVRDARRGGLVILHAIWGVTPHLRELADGFAEDCFCRMRKTVQAKRGEHQKIVQHLIGS